MMTSIRRKHENHLYRFISAFIAFTFSFTSVLPPAYAQVGTGFKPVPTILNLPAPGTMVPPSPAFVPVLLKGMTIHPENPLQFDFIIDTGNTGLDVGNGRDRSLQEESEKLVKYFLASMTIPKDDLWVNLSPYESDKIIPDELGRTELGRDMLAQDYILKQLTASLMYPEKELGKEFWARVYKLAQEKYGTTEIPVNTFNKVWILPETVTVYEHGQTVYIVEAKLRVMLEQDYVALQHNLAETPAFLFPFGKQQGLDEDYVAMNAGVGASLVGARNRAETSPAPTENNISTSIIREIILPEIEHEVNYGQNFAPLRQIYHSLILAKWYKETIKESLLSKIYVDQKKIAGVDIDDATLKDQIYAQYMEAYRKGVFNYIKEDYDRLSNETIPRKYFSGGEELTKIPLTKTTSGSPIKGDGFLGKGVKLFVALTLAGSLYQSPTVFAQLPSMPPIEKRSVYNPATGQTSEVWVTPDLDEFIPGPKFLDFIIKWLSQPDSLGIGWSLEVKPLLGLTFENENLIRQVSELKDEEIKGTGIEYLSSIGFYVKYEYKGKEYFRSLKGNSYVILPQDTEKLGEVYKSRYPIIVELSSSFLKRQLEFIQGFGMIRNSKGNFIKLTKEVLEDILLGKGGHLEYHWNIRQLSVIYNNGQKARFWFGKEGAAFEKHFFSNRIGFIRREGQDSVELTAEDLEWLIQKAGDSIDPYYDGVTGENLGDPRSSRNLVVIIDKNKVSLDLGDEGRKIVNKFLRTREPWKSDLKPSSSPITGEKLNQVKEILNMFGINKIESANELDGGVGSQDKPIHVFSPQGEMVLRKSRYAEPQLKFIVSVMNRLKSEGIPVPTLYYRKGSDILQSESYIADYQGSHYTLEEYLTTGKNIPLEDVSRDQFIEIAQLAAKMNNALSGFQPQGNKRFKSRTEIAADIQGSFAEYAKRVESLPSDERKEGHILFGRYSDFFMSQLEIFRQRYDADAQKTSITHSDLHPGNIKFDDMGKIVGLIDFDFTITDHRVVEFNNLIMGKDDVAKDLPYSRDKMLAMVSAYNRAVNDKLSDAEIKAIIEVIRLRFLEEIHSRFVRENFHIPTNIFEHPDQLPFAYTSINLFQQFAEDFSMDKKIQAFVEEVNESGTIPDSHVQSSSPILEPPYKLNSLTDGKGYQIPALNLSKPNLFTQIGFLGNLIVKVPSKRGIGDFEKYVKNETSDPQDIRQNEPLERFGNLDNAVKIFPEFKTTRDLFGDDIAHFLIVHRLQHERLKTSGLIGIPATRFVVLEWPGRLWGKYTSPAIIQEKIQGTSLWDMVDPITGEFRPAYLQLRSKLRYQIEPLVNSKLGIHIDWNIQNFVWNETEERLYYVDSKPTTIASKFGVEHNLSSLREIFINYNQSSSPISADDLLSVPAGLIGALEENGQILSVKAGEIFDIGFGDYWNQVQEFAVEYPDLVTIGGLLAATAGVTGGLYYFWSRYTVSGNIHRLSSDNWEIRRDAVKKLGESKNKRAVPPIIERLSDPDFSVRQSAAEALGKLGDSRAVEPLIQVLKDSYSSVRRSAAEALGKLGDSRAVEPLQKLLSATSKTIEVDEYYGPYGEFSGTRSEDNPEYSAIEDALNKLRAKPGETSSSPIQTPKLNRALVEKILTERKISLNDIQDKRLRNFLVFLQKNNLKDIVIMGGAIKSILFDEKVNDIDISIKMSLTDEERISLDPLNAMASEKAYNHSLENLTRLAKAMNVEVSLFLPPARGLTTAFEGLDIDYFGPIQTDRGMVIKRSLFDAVTRNGYFTNTAASLLRFAIDADGNIYGDVDSLKDVLQGKATIQGDGTNFGINEVLRVLRVKRQYGLWISNEDDQLLKEAISRLKNRTIPPIALEVARDQIGKLLANAIDQKAARQELEALGIFALVAQSSPSTPLGASSPPAEKQGPETTKYDVRTTNDEDVGGIDLNSIDLDREGAGVEIQFDPAQLQDIIDAGIDGFTPVIINITPLPSILPLLGLDPAIKEDLLELSAASG